MSPSFAMAQPSLPRPAECPARTRNRSESKQEAASYGFTPTPKSGVSNCQGPLLQELAWARKASVELGSSQRLQPPRKGAGRPINADVPKEGGLFHTGRAEIRAAAQLDPGLLLKAPKGGPCRRGRASSSGGPHAAAVPTTPAVPGSGRSQSLCHPLGHGSASQLTSSLAQLQHGRAALPGAPGCSGCLGCHARTASHHVSLERRRGGLSSEAAGQRPQRASHSESPGGH